jgi:CDP-diglyceride synthetase/subtilisin-like proprotein convertase family protein
MKFDARKLMNMGEHNDDDPAEEPVEGVRLVNKEEAEAALEKGLAISKNSQGRLVSLVGYETGDPEPTWADTEDDASSSIRIIGSAERVSATLRMPDSTRGTSASPASSGSTTIDDDFDFLDLRSEHRPDDDEPVVEQADDHDQMVSAPQTSSHQLPHWTEPASGEVPAVLDNGGGDEGSGNQWSLNEFSDASQLGDSDDDELDAKFAALGEVPAVDAEPPAADDTVIAEPITEAVPVIDDTASATSTSEKHTPIDTIEEKVESLKKASIVTRSATAGVAAVLAIAAFAAGPAWAMVLSLVVVMLAAVEYFDALRRVGYRPATALGLVAVAGAVLGTYARGEAAIPLVFALATAFTFLWYLTGIIRDSPTANISVTLLGVMWIGVFGSYAALLLREPDNRGIAFLGAAVILVIAYDTFAYLGGVLFGRHKLIPSISPGKTWEGLGVATAATILFGMVVIPFIHPWGIWDGIVLGIVISCVAPLGDLAESMIKRDLGLKDMGRLLPGHGGALDRFDALLFALPATYYVVRMLNLV